MKNKKKTAFVTGVTGQDGAYLSEFLIAKGYKVYGGFRRSSSVNFWRLDELNLLNNQNLELVEFDLTDISSTLSVIRKTKPDEIYNLAAQSFVGVSFEQPMLTSSITALGALNLLESIRIIDPKIKFYQASTSEMFGKVQSIPQTEDTPFYPRSPYGVAKLYAHWMTINYRESYNIFGSSGILFNHESPLRGIEFVTRKITNSVAKIKLGQLDTFELGNIDAKRDWGFAKDYVEGMWKILQAKKADSFVLSTNQTSTVRDFVKLSFEAVDIEIEFRGKGIKEVAIEKSSGKTLMKISKNFYRPAEVDLLIGDATKAKKILNWESKTSLKELCNMMVAADLKRESKEF